MAKKSMIQRELKRARTVARYAEKRASLKAIIQSPQSSDEFEAAEMNTSLPWPLIVGTSPAAMGETCTW